MKKIGIVTFYYNSINYGGILQSYALCKILADYGYHAEQISYKGDIKTKKQLIIETLSDLSILQYRIRAILNAFNTKIHRTTSYIQQRNQSFQHFKECIPHSNVVYSSKSLSKCNGYDVYITGSDQVWNVGTSQQVHPFYWLKFVNCGKKMSYAASLSTSIILNKTRKEIKNALSDYVGISVREFQDKDTIDEIMGEKVTKWVLDPTLLISRDCWLEICQANPYKSEKYVFAYLLGDNVKYRKMIESYAKINNLKIVTIPYLLNYYRSCDKEFGDISRTNICPELWLSIIRDAETVFTDSFHGIVFSVIFRKEFYALKRFRDSDKDSMNSRIYSILKLIGCENRLINDIRDPRDLNNIPKIDFKVVTEIIDNERKYSLGYLISTIEG